MLRRIHTKSNSVKNLLPTLSFNSKISGPIQKEIDLVLENPPQIPSVINGRKITQMNQTQMAGQKVVCHYNYCEKQELLDGLYGYREAKEKWNQYTLIDRLDIFQDAADRLEYDYYDRMMAYTILGQNKTPFEAEIDSICELVDFLRFNVDYVYQIQKKQPISQVMEKYGKKKYQIRNSSEYLPLNGFIASITPFNFTAIGGNLALTPLMLGNSVFWKPSDNAILSNYLIYQILEECGLPPGILNFTPQDPEIFLDKVIKNADLGGILFTGSSQVFNDIYRKVGENMNHYRNYPRLIGETGGKNYHFVHPSYQNDIQYLVDKTFESAFSYSGQKCSACSRLYIPDFMVPEFLEKMEVRIQEFMEIHGDNYGLINEKSWLKTQDVLERIKKTGYAKIVRGGEGNPENYMLEPTIVSVSNSTNFLFSEEFFAPILSIYSYSPKKIEETMELCEKSSGYALTGALFCQDKNFTDYFKEKMRYTCGNFYINDKSTGSVVGQQPFGGSGKSGTNDKAGDINFIYRLTNQKNVKE